MAVNYFTLGFIGGSVGGCIQHNGVSQLKKELQGAKYSLIKKSPNLDAIVQTPGLGEFEIKITKNHKGKLDLDEINYDPHSMYLPKMDLYQNSGTIMPSASTSPFSYKITTKNQNTTVRIFIDYGIMKGSTKLNISPDKNGVYQIKRVTFYDSSGNRWFSFVPPARKPKSAVFSSASSLPGTSTGKPSP
ncbi:MAG TPA: hypothetical protein VJ461_04415 [Candidatus Nanoarchaeia archaeon]|nr:hypothetical protein [Candidatus Nanoarchaeia archaeon]